jgi:plasmid stabilization system protein ParE
VVARRGVVWSEQGTRTLDEVIAFIANDSVSDARRVLQRALDSAASLARLSERGRVVPELRVPNVREVAVHRYRLIDEVGADRVTVLAFIHSARDFGIWQQRTGR